VHAERTVPPVKNSDTIKFLHCIDDCLLVCLIAAMNHNTAAKNRSTHVKTVEGAYVPTGRTNGGAQPTKGRERLKMRRWEELT
jgi:hypothetical protein